MATQRSLSKCHSTPTPYLLSLQPTTDATAELGRLGVTSHNLNRAPLESPVCRRW